MKKLILFLFLALAVNSGFAQKEKPLKITFKEGNSYHVNMTEILYLRQQSSQVDSENVEPSWRTTVYNFTETIEKVNLDGSAQVASTLDSFSTRIIVGKNIDRNEFFRFNSTNEYDVQNRLRDIRALPRAQFLGQTLHYTLGNDGLVKNFQNLSAFQQATYAKNFDYDMLHAMMSFADSLRIGQLLEQGFGAVAALVESQPASIQTPYTLTEIHLTRNLKASKKGNQITYTGNYTDVPDSINYLEGIAFPLVIEHFKGMTKGTVKFDDGIAESGKALDSATFDLTLPGDVIKSMVTRNTSFERKPIKTLRGASIKIKELESHHTPPPAQVDFPDDPDTKVITIDPNVLQDTTKKK